jgi:hypothetical protein
LADGDFPGLLAPEEEQRSSLEISRRGSPSTGYIEAAKAVFGPEMVRFSVASAAWTVNRVDLSATHDTEKGVCTLQKPPANRKF